MVHLTDAGASGILHDSNQCYTVKPNVNSKTTVNPSGAMLCQGWQGELPDTNYKPQMYLDEQHYHIHTLYARRLMSSNVDKCAIEPAQDDEQSD